MVDPIKGRFHILWCIGSGDIDRLICELNALHVAQGVHALITVSNRVVSNAQSAVGSRSKSEVRTWAVVHSDIELGAVCGPLDRANDAQLRDGEVLLPHSSGELRHAVDEYSRCI